MSTDTQELIQAYEKLSDAKRAELADFARFLLIRESDACGERLVWEPGSSLTEPGQTATATFRIDPASGLPVIDSPYNAPVRSTNIEDTLRLIDETQEEEDCGRAGLPIRH